MLIILGASGSGKTTLQKYICNNTNMKRAISCTTRPMRDGEIEGVDYKFINEDEFIKLKNEGYFAETSNYREWLYGIGIDQITKNSCLVATPEGLIKIKKTIEKNGLCIPLKSIYIETEQKERLINLIKTRDDTMEILRREFSDVIMFKNIYKEVDFVLHNDYKKSMEELFNILKEEKLIE